MVKLYSVEYQDKKYEAFITPDFPGGHIYTLIDIAKGWVYTRADTINGGRENYPPEYINIKVYNVHRDELSNIHRLKIIYLGGE